MKILLGDFNVKVGREDTVACFPHAVSVQAIETSRNAIAQQ
jgi:hypothetical protein